MVSGQSTVRRYRGGPLGLLLAVLALVSQVALGAVVLPDQAVAREQTAEALDALAVLCVSGTPAVPSREPERHRHAPDSAICPLAAALALPAAALLASGPDVQVPGSGPAARPGLPPPARAPPEQPRVTPPPRGPPALS